MNQEQLANYNHIIREKQKHIDKLERELMKAQSVPAVPVSKSPTTSTVSAQNEEEFVVHEYIDREAIKARFDYYKSEDEKVPSSLSFINSIAKGGYGKKSLSVVQAGTGTGKSLFMCSEAAAGVNAGKNVLYITLEMSETRIAQRIDQNLMGLKEEEIAGLDEEGFNSRIEKYVLKDGIGNLFIKEYPTGVAGANDFRQLINYLIEEYGVQLDLICIDYLNICKPTKGDGSALGSEMRAIAIDYDVPVLTAVQTSRQAEERMNRAIRNQEEYYYSLTDAEKSFDCPRVADLMFAITKTPDYSLMGCLRLHQLKNRYAGIDAWFETLVAVNYGLMRVSDYQVEEATEQLIKQAAERREIEEAVSKKLRRLKPDTANWSSDTKFRDRKPRKNELNGEEVKAFFCTPYGIAEATVIERAVKKGSQAILKRENWGHYWAVCDEPKDITTFTQQGWELLIKNHGKAIHFNEWEYWDIETLDYCELKRMTALYHKARSERNEEQKSNRRLHNQVSNLKRERVDAIDLMGKAQRETQSIRQAQEFRIDQIEELKRERDIYKRNYYELVKAAKGEEEGTVEVFDPFKPAVGQ